MSKIFKIRVVLDVVEDVYRDIEIEANAPLLHLHAATLDAFGWQGDEMASFYRSNEQWDRGDEIPLMAMPDGFEEFEEELDFEDIDLSATNRQDQTSSMESQRVSDMLSSAGDRAIYVYDFLRMWCFYVELIEVAESETGASYPRLAGEFGEAPAPESREVDLSDLGEMDMGRVERTSTGDAELDAYLNDDEEDEDEDDEDRYTSLDDLDHDLY